MTTRTRLLPPPDLEYPETDGLPMAESTLQFQWIVTIQGNLDGQFSDDPPVFVAGDLFWYPVQGQPGIRTAPDIMIAFGRPKGHRRSYKQWEEGGVAPQVVWEILSPSNRPAEMEEKFAFFERFGVQEYYIYDPQKHELSGWVRVGDSLQEIARMQDWVSPRLHIRFDMSGKELVLYRPDGQRFLTFLEALAVWEKAKGQTQGERQARERAEQATEQERKSREEAQRKAELYAERLRTLGIDPDSLS